MFIDFSVVTAMSCMSCFECTTGETASSWRLLDSGQVRIKVESIVPQSRGAFLNFVFLSIDALVYDVFSTPFWKLQMLRCHLKPDKMGFQPYWISTKVFRNIWKIKRFWSSFQSFPSKTCAGGKPCPPALQWPLQTIPLELYPGALTWKSALLAAKQYEIKHKKYVFRPIQAIWYWYIIQEM